MRKKNYTILYRDTHVVYACVLYCTAYKYICKDKRTISLRRIILDFISIYHKAGSLFISLQPSYGISNCENNGKRTCIPPMEFKVQWIECVTMALTSWNRNKKKKRKKVRGRISIWLIKKSRNKSKCEYCIFFSVCVSVCVCVYMRVWQTESACLCVQCVYVWAYIRRGKTYEILAS